MPTQGMENQSHICKPFILWKVTCLLIQHYEIVNIIQITLLVCTYLYPHFTQRCSKKQRSGKANVRRRCHCSERWIIFFGFNSLPLQTHIMSCHSVPFLQFQFLRRPSPFYRVYHGIHKVWFQANGIIVQKMSLTLWVFKSNHKIINPPILPMFSQIPWYNRYLSYFTVFISFFITLSYRETLSISHYFFLSIYLSHSLDVCYVSLSPPSNKVLFLSSFHFEYEEMR